jgi:hypothetical protein
MLRNRWLLACLIYVFSTLIFVAFTGDRLDKPTQNNHFAIQAELWAQNRWYLPEQEMQARARRGEVEMGNDWAVVTVPASPGHAREVRYYNSFPVFPAVLMYPWVVLAGHAVMFRDALFVALLAGIGPSLLFLALEKLRSDDRLARNVFENTFLALLFAFGTVYFFCSVQGTVWFAAHVVGVALLGGFLLATFSARTYVACLIAGLLVGAGVHTRTPLLLVFPLFIFEAYRVSLARTWRAFGARFAGRLMLFGAPIVIALALNLWINKARFGDPFEFGHTLLNVGWMDRVKRWGLFSPHYLSRNLTCAFTLLPILRGPHAPLSAPLFQISGNGLALWFTSPFYVWLLWPKKRAVNASRALHRVLWLTVILIAMMDLAYHNSGWVQFGFRFSNDFAPFLFVLLALSGRSFGGGFALAALFSVVVNAFGALTFNRSAYSAYYFFQTYTVPIAGGQTGIQSSTYPPD